MNSQKLLLSLFTLALFLTEQGSAGGRHLHRQFRARKLYVFGDSYVDTGNIGISNFSCRHLPYGITFPGKPSGRFSDGRVLTDFTANYLGLKGPVPFRILKDKGITGKEDGINFAFAGTGVFDTSFSFPNMSTQIDLFENFIIKSSFYTKHIRSSLALVSVSGNDYSFYLAQNGSDLQGLKELTNSVVNQTIRNIKRINTLGVKKVVMTGLGPVGCLPQFTAPFSFKQCNATINNLVGLHNLLLKKGIAKLNSENKDSSNYFLVIDIYGAFMHFIQSKGSLQKGSIRFETPLKPCCFGVSSEFSCGSVDKKGDKKYSLCEDPKSAFFWDLVHPTQEGWLAAFTSLQFDLKQLF